MLEIRCGSCNRKLGTGEYSRLRIKCPRCGTLNDLRAASPTPARHRSPIKEHEHDASDTRGEVAPVLGRR